MAYPYSSRRCFFDQDGWHPGRITTDSTRPVPLRINTGVLQKPSSLCVAVETQFSAYFQPSLKVYITKLDVNLKKGRINVRLVACDACNGTEPQSYYRSDVILQFDGGVS